MQWFLMQGLWLHWLPLSNGEKRLLAALLQGAHLKAHRYVDGSKVHKLHFDKTDQTKIGPTEIIADNIVEGLSRRKLICSNMKFPAATYVLTEAGKKRGSLLVKQALSPVTSHL